MAELMAESITPAVFAAFQRAVLWEVLQSSSGIIATPSGRGKTCLLSSRCAVMPCGKPPCWFKKKATQARMDLAADLVASLGVLFWRSSGLPPVQPMIEAMHHTVFAFPRDNFEQRLTEGLHEIRMSELRIAISEDDRRILRRYACSRVRGRV